MVVLQSYFLWSEKPLRFRFFFKFFALEIIFFVYLASNTLQFRTPCCVSCFYRINIAFADVNLLMLMPPAASLTGDEIQYGIVYSETESIIKMIKRETP